MSKNSQPPLFATPSARPGRTGAGQPTPVEVHEAFDSTRLTQARHLAGMTKRRLADELGVTPAAVSQYEMGTNRPRPDLLPRLAEVLDVPLAFFLTRPPYVRLDSSAAHFRSLRNTRSYQRAKAIALTEQVWELAYALEKRVRLPSVDLPGFTGGEVHPGTELPTDPAAAAQALRAAWGLGTGPITHLVRRLEAHGIVVHTSQRDDDMRSVDAFSTPRLPRPVIVLTPNRTDDVYNHRFSAAHELGHLVVHGEATPGDITQEREADAFAAEFLTPRESILPELPARADLHRLSQLRSAWGVSVKSLVYRCRELGLLSDSSASRAYQRLHSLEGQPGFAAEPPAGYPGELPALLSQAFDLACDHGLTITELARELAWTVPRVRQMLGIEMQRPVLRLLAGQP
ncbi:ImmA/IrrE family metallo-endopeptidase [Frankia sp. AgB1.9]|uniref:helix-turn-helix domain-containing protein n=1 Tax=unclassified Frankia TaxID=2632575 RepID=UPI001933F8C6|nr:MULTISPECIES: XRE family transcriptional regulator [unclassified Frankia]MBL7491519.1 ImmA/IrrE family metallo-endopeptidase [Frankia sp. AgW1.1]MBL7552492.1 ImmA/IrrE family metallo-endopeptidase [Frankia sp. AgB1.9]MBL7622107.1 ImmA/IrrE family metallo-endopeptidase [Frankia sp. AgB1.8]